MSMMMMMTINLFSKTAISILVISNPNSFRVLFDKIASVCFVGKMYSYFSIGNGQPREPALCQLHRHTFVPYMTVFVEHNREPYKTDEPIKVPFGVWTGVGP